MSEFQPYHAAIVATITELGPDSPHYLVLLRAFAEFAQTVKVPAAHREEVRQAFERHKSVIRGSENPDAKQAFHACQCATMALQQQYNEDPKEKQT